MRGAGPIRPRCLRGPSGAITPALRRSGSGSIQGVGKIMGHPYVDGHHTVELSVSAGSVEVYVIFADVHSYQVVRSINYFNQASHAPPITANYPWVPRTPAMVGGRRPGDPGRLHPGPRRRLAAEPLARAGRGARERPAKASRPGLFRPGLDFEA